MSPSITGAIVGAIIAVIVYVVLTSLIVFRLSDLVFGLIAVLIFLACTFNWSGFNVRP